MSPLALCASATPIWFTPWAGTQAQAAPCLLQTLCSTIWSSLSTDDLSLPPETPVAHLASRLGTSLLPGGRRSLPAPQASSRLHVPIMSVTLWADQPPPGATGHACTWSKEQGVCPLEGIRLPALGRHEARTRPLGLTCTPQARCIPRGASYSLVYTRLGTEMQRRQLWQAGRQGPLPPLPSVWASPCPHSWPIQPSMQALWPYWSQV